MAGDAKAKKDNKVCQKMMSDLDESGMGVRGAMISEPFTRIFDQVELGAVC